MPEGSAETEKNDKLPTAGEVVTTKHHRYDTVKLLGKGGFGAVYMVKREDGEVFAMKCETTDVKKLVLSMDCKVLRGTFLIQSPHFCAVLDRGKVADRFRFLVMKLVGKNLWDLRIEREPPKFTMNTSLKAAEQCMMAIQDLHSVGFLHRDIKPGNFAIGRPETNEHHTIFMLDFGLCRKFVGESQVKDLRMPRSQAPFRGTTRYASQAALKTQEQSRKDDMEAWLYMVAEWTTGALPWRRLKGTDKDDVLRWKEDIRGELHDEFLEGLPKKEFSEIMRYIDTLEYQNIPDYEFVYYCLSHAAKTQGCGPTDPLDWDPGNKYHGPTPADREKKQKVAVAEGKYNQKQSKDSKDF
uniref:Protein kinase domain-containing protein n=2 Tax=Panagrolaimus sp. JU765 TaxID=591449 RepID=A0AC34R942_9BILA